MRRVGEWNGIPVWEVDDTDPLPPPGFPPGLVMCWSGDDAAYLRGVAGTTEECAGSEDTRPSAGLPSRCTGRHFLSSLTCDEPLPLPKPNYDPPHDGYGCAVAIGCALIFWCAVVGAVLLAVR